MARVTCAVVFCLLVGCGKNAKEVLQSKHRPEPIECANTGDRQNTCVDAAGLIWTCGHMSGVDDECIQTGQRTPEVK